MALLNPTFVFGIVVLIYLSSFVLFAILRILTGLSIQRIGYFSLRRLAYTPKDGCRVEIRGLGFNVHRPTFAQPTWISLVLQEVVVTVDIRELEGRKVKDMGEDEDEADTANEKEATKENDRPQSARRQATPVTRSETWKHLTKIKEKIKQLHTKVKYLRMIDVVATNSAINVVEVGTLQVGSFTLAVDTRRKTVDRARFFSRRSEAQKEDRQAEWILTMRSVLFTAEGKESMEVLDHAMLNIHGFLYASRRGLRDAALSLKLGRLHVPYDDIERCRNLYKMCKKDPRSATNDEPLDIFLGNVVQEVGKPGSTNEDLIRTVSDSKEFFSSILRGIKEVQFAVGFVGMTKKIDSIRPAAQPILLTAAMKEVGIDLHRLDPKSPSHRMYFPSKDIAHEALAAALSISVGLDDGSGEPERLVYIPMATTTVRTTLPSKTVEFAQEDVIKEKNANILFANAVVTSPSVDLDPRHLPLLIALLQPKPKSQKTQESRRHSLISRLLPKANMKFSLHEPVVRIKLKPLSKTEDPDDFDLIISSISSISLDMESSHSIVEDLHYSLDGALRLQSHNLYYQTNSGERFNLITTESFDMKVHLGARPDVSVELSGNVQSFSISMVRPEITDGLRQIVRELRIEVEPEKKVSAHSARHQNFLRAMPDWLNRYHFEATDFNVEVAGVDEDISDETRGISLHLDILSAEYQAQKIENLPLRLARRRTHSRSMTQSDSDLTPSPHSPRAKQKTQNPGDGRRLAFQARGLEAQIMENPEKLEIEPFLAMPRFDIVLSVNSDKHGPLFHVQSAIKSIVAHYSLYRHYSVGVAVMTLRKAFMRTGQDIPRAKSEGVARKSDRLAPPTPGLHSDVEGLSTVTPELLTVDVKVSMVQVKADLPHEPAMMLHIYGLEVGRLRWTNPFVLTRLIRVYCEPPRMRNVWARLIGIKGGRLDMRESKRKTGSGRVVEEKLIDVTSEAVRIAVPHEVIFNRITDNFVNVFKSCQQLHHRFKTGTNEYILEKKPEGPKSVPKISIRTRNFQFEMEDGAFEWKLGMIYRTGRNEQMQRLTREEAFRVKAKRVREEEARKGSKMRSRSAHHRGRTENPGTSSSWFRGRILDALRMNEGAAPSKNRIPRYDPDGESQGISGQTKVSEHEARHQLDVYNAQSWKRRIDRSYELSRDSMAEVRKKFWGSNELPDDVEETENILSVPQRPALMAANVTDLHLVIDKPTFAMSELPDFLHKVGKGMPKDMVYGLLVPMHIAIEMGEVKLTLRDYPLPIVHIPGLKPGQNTRQAAVSLKTNFVLAEEFRGMESTRKVRVNVVPPKNMDPLSSNEGSFAIEVRRTIGPVKSFSDVYMDINTSLPTRLTWGPCYQPAIQDMMMVVESFTKPQIDTSERVGFWDKLRLNFHSRIHMAWKGDGDLHIGLKGTRDPYQVTGNGAGFLMCWRNDVRWNINAEDDPKRFMTVDSGEYVLAVPDYSHQVREAARRYLDEQSPVLEDTCKSGAIFRKVVMKLSGKVQWMAGIMFEKAIEEGNRSFEFKPHYDVVLKNPHYVKTDGDLPYDAMRGFRSRHIHLSIAVRAPVDRDWLAENPEPSRSYNTVHLTPRFFTHFFHWWGLFGQPMSLPIRQGNLFPGREKNSKKFGRHLATVKYNLLLAPLFLSHIYKHKDVEDYSENAVSATGLKVRFDSFMLDLHQRREEFNTLGKSKSAQGRTTGIKIHAAQLDLASADIRAVSASLKGTTTEAIKKGSISTLITDQHEKPDLSRFTIPDNDYSWIDMDDFVELDWILPTEPHPDTKIMPLAYAPRLTYVRQTDIGNTISGDPNRTSPFGDEPTHFCIMTRDDEPKRVQANLISERLEQLQTQMQSHARNLGEAELRMIRTDSKDEEVMNDFEAMRKHTHVLREKKTFLEDMVEQMTQQMPPKGQPLPDNLSKEASEETMGSMGTQDETIQIPATTEFESDFTNRFVVHNMQLKWNNLLRNIVLRYIHQNSQRRGFIYYLSRPAVKFILDIVEEQNRAKANKSSNTNGNGNGNTKPPSTTGTTTGTSSSPDPSIQEKDSMQELEDRIKNFLGDGRKFTSASFSANPEGNLNGTIEDLKCGISDDFTPQSSYHVRLIAPQIQLQSDKNKKHVVLIAAKGMELKVLEVMDKKRMSDNVSGLVQRRFLVNMDSTQFFVTHQKWFATHLVSMYAGSKYGTPTGSSWPPWVPMEVMFDFRSDPFGFKRVVEKTSAMLRYDKYNTLRLKYNDEVNTEGNEASAESSENRMDNLWVEFPRARAICNSSQYYALYVIVLDLLMYSEPLEKTRTERLEKIMLASDFSDLSGTPQMVQRLQERIRQLEQIKYHFQIYSKYLDKKGWEDRLSLERDLAASEDELFFVMKAITTSQRKFDLNSDNNALLKWSICARDIVWHLMQSSNEPLVELQLKDLQYDRTDNADGSHMNLVRVGKVLGLNLLPDATYPEIIAPYQDEEAKPQGPQESDMIRVYWYMLEAIAGIPVMDRFEVNLFPMKIQLEREVGKRLFEYIFPGIDGSKTPGGKNDSPLMIKHGTNNQQEEEDDESLNTASSSRLSVNSAEKESTAFSTRAGSLELRLRPTLTSNTHATFPNERSPKKTGLTINTGEGHGFRLFRSSGTSKTVSKKSSYDSLRAMSSPRPGNIPRSSTGFSSKDGRDSTTSDGKKARFNLRGKDRDEKLQSDDLTKMIDRASNYMTFSSIRMPSVVLCLSYKGEKERNLEDLHDFVFRLPTLEWQNKTWSNLDLALALKKAVIKALISHTGAILGNKFSRHRPTAEQRSKLREMVNSSVMIAPQAPASGSQNYAGSVNDSDDSSQYGGSQVDWSRSPPRSTRSTHSSIPGPSSRSSSIASGREHRRASATPMPAFLTRTPPTPVDGPSRAGTGDVELLGSSSSNGMFSVPHRQMLKSATGDGPRPSTSASNERRKSGPGFRDRLSALTHRMRDGGSTVQDEEEAVDDGDGGAGGGKPSVSKRMTWAPSGRVKTG